MQVLQSANLALMFGLELAVYGAVVYWAVVTRSSVVGRVLAAVVGVALMAVVWGLVGAPRAPWPATGGWRVLLEVLWFGVGFLALYRAGRVRPAVVFAAVYLVNAILRVVWNQV